MILNELRKGNLINCLHHNNDSPDPVKFNLPVTVKVIGPDYIVTQNHQQVEEEYLSGIKLTEKWLIKFGLNKSFNSLTYCNDWFCNTFIISELNENFCLKLSKGVVEIKFVHQLQNLYFALTNTELCLQN